MQKEKGQKRGHDGRAIRKGGQEMIRKIDKKVTREDEKKGATERERERQPETVFKLLRSPGIDSSNSM
jgi:hypothetical protein